MNFYRPPLEAEFATLTNKYNNFTECGVSIVLRVAHYEAHTIVNRKPTGGVVRNRLLRIARSIAQVICLEIIV